MVVQNMVHVLVALAVFYTKAALDDEERDARLAQRKKVRARRQKKKMYTRCNKNQLNKVGDIGSQPSAVIHS